MTPKMTKKRLSLKKRGLVTTVQPKPEFSRTCGFRKVLGINEDCSNAKFSSKFLEPFLRYGKKTSKMPQKWGFSPNCDPPRFFFKNRALSLLSRYGVLTSCKKIRKNLWTVSEIFKDGRTDQRTNGLTRAITKDLLRYTRGPIIG